MMESSERMSGEDRQSMYMAAALSTALIVALTILLVTHIYFTWTSMSSVESAGLMDFNPFFEPTPSQRGDKT